MQCNLCGKEFETQVGQASCQSKMLLHMKHHLGYNQSKKRQMEESSSICPDCGGTGKSHSYQCPHSKIQRSDQEEPKSNPSKTLVRCSDCNMSTYSSQKSCHADTCGKTFQGLDGRAKMTACKNCTKVMTDAILASHACDQPASEAKTVSTTEPKARESTTRPKARESTTVPKALESSTAPKAPESTTGLKAPESSTGPKAPESTTVLAAPGSSTVLTPGVVKKRVRCPQCGGVILQEEKQRHTAQCPGLLA